MALVVEGGALRGLRKFGVEQVLQTAMEEETVRWPRVGMGGVKRTFAEKLLLFLQKGVLELGGDRGVAVYRSVNGRRLFSGE